MVYLQATYMYFVCGLHVSYTSIGALYCIVSIHVYIASCSAHQSEALPVRDTQREETFHLGIVFHLSYMVVFHRGVHHPSTCEAFPLFENMLKTTYDKFS